jgi:hypothetical protein
MESARSLALGGQVIYASEMAKRIYLDANDLMLRCPFCGEPVFFKAGLQKTPHFAHFPDLPTRQLEDCELRQYSAGGSGFFGESQDRGQSLERFQQRIKSIFANEYRQFNSKVLYMQKNRKEAIEHYSEYYLGNYLFIFDATRKMCREKFSGDPISILMMREKILVEVIGYLNNKSAKEVLNSFVAFSLYQYKSHPEQHEHFSDKDLLTTLCKNLAEVKWLEAFKLILLEFEKEQSLGIHNSNIENRKDKKQNIIAVLGRARYN